MNKWWLFPLLLLAACTGSSEPALRSLLAAATGQEIRFYQTDTLQPGFTDSAPLQVGSWNMGEDVLALRYRRNLVGGADQLWVLSKNRLRRYRTTNLGVSSVGTPALAFDNFELPTGQDCSLGYLRLGNLNILLVCPNPSATSTALPTVWRIPLSFDTTAATQLPQPLALSSFPSQISQAQNTVRFTLNPQNEWLVYVSKNNIGSIDPDNFSDTTSQINRVLVNPLLGRTFSDLVFVGNQAWALAPREPNNTLQPPTTLISWAPSATTDPTLRVNDKLIASTFGANDTTSTALSLLGAGFSQYSDTFHFIPSDFFPNGSGFTASVTGLDQYLYLAEGGTNLSTRLWVLDITGNLENLSSQGVRAINDFSFPTVIRSLSFIPVE